MDIGGVHELGGAPQAAASLDSISSSSLAYGLCQLSETGSWTQLSPMAKPQDMRVTPTRIPHTKLREFPRSTMSSRVVRKGLSDERDSCLASVSRSEADSAEYITIPPPTRASHAPVDIKSDAS